MRDLKSLLFLMILLHLTPVNGYAQMTEEEALAKFVSAGMSYKEGQYEDAITKYRQIIDGMRESGAVYYNLGNSYFRKGDLGRAVLNYERAKRLIPRDSDLTFNDRYVSSRIERHDSGEKVNLLDRAMRNYAGFYTVDEMVMIIAGTVFVLGIIALLSLYLDWPNSLSRGIMTFLALVAIIHAIGLAGRTGYDKDLAVVVTAAESYFEPRADSTVHFRLSEGMKARIIRTEGNWTKIERLDGKAGWVPVGVLEKI